MGEDGQADGHQGGLKELFAKVAMSALDLDAGLGLGYQDEHAESVRGADRERGREVGQGDQECRDKVGVAR